MKKAKTGTCPGCSRHCSAGSVRCKYGRQYFARFEAAAAAEAGAAVKKRKWEKYVAVGGLLWSLLSVGGAVKKSLRRGRVTEKQLVEPLSEDEQRALRAALDKIGHCLK